MGKHVPDRRFKDICGLKSFSPRTSGTLSSWCTATPPLTSARRRTQCVTCPLTALSCYNGAEGEIAGRGVAMTAEISTCNNCGKQGYYARNCYADKADSVKKSPEVYDKQKER